MNTSKILRPFVHLFLLTLIIASTMTLCIGQSLTNPTISGYQANFATLSNQGNTLMIQLALTNNSQAEAAVKGFNLSVLFPGFTSPASEVIVSTQDSWIGTAAEGNLSYTYDATLSEVNLSYLRSDGNGQSGQGAVAVFTFIREGGFSALEAQAAVSGGLVMVDNLDFKWNPQSTPVKISAYPNPCTETLKVTCSDAAASNATLYSLDGKQVLASQDKVRHQLDVRHLATGTYLLSVTSQNHTFSKKISIQPNF